MREKEIDILSTRELADSLVLKAAYNNIRIQQVPFISVKLESSKNIRSGIDQLPYRINDIILTSVNGVNAFIDAYQGEPGLNFYCVGEITAKKLKDKFPGANIISDQNSVTLAEKILKQSISETYIYFCGNRRRDELPGLLKAAGQKVYEIEAYRTDLTPSKIEKTYDGYLFFSPSAAESFSTLNSFSPSSTCFVIGDTTANALKQYSPGKVVISKKPDAGSMIQTTIDYYKYN